MPGLPVYHQVGTGTSDYNAPLAPPGPSQAVGSGANGHLMFIVWVIVLGLLIPGLILGGLDLAGFRFVFKHR